MPWYFLGIACKNLNGTIEEKDGIRKIVVFSANEFDMYQLV